VARKVLTDLEKLAKKHEKEIRVLLAKEGGQTFVDEWLQKDCQSLGGKTPRQIIDSGDGETIKTLLKKIFKYDQKAKEDINLHSAKHKIHVAQRGDRGQPQGSLAQSKDQKSNGQTKPLFPKPR